MVMSSDRFEPTSRCSLREETVDPPAGKVRVNVASRQLTNAASYAGTLLAAAGLFVLVLPPFTGTTVSLFCERRSQSYETPAEP